jgi:hypothetical protein
LAVDRSGIGTRTRTPWGLVPSDGGRAHLGSSPELARALRFGWVRGLRTLLHRGAGSTPSGCSLERSGGWWRDEAPTLVGSSEQMRGGVESSRLRFRPQPAESFEEWVEIGGSAPPDGSSEPAAFDFGRARCGNVGHQRLRSRPTSLLRVGSSALLCRLASHRPTHFGGVGGQCVVQRSSDQCTARSRPRRNA